MLNLNIRVLLIILFLIQFVCASQPINALAFILDGLHYGVSDFKYAASSMVYSTILVFVLHYAGYDANCILIYAALMNYRWWSEQYLQHSCIMLPQFLGFLAFGQD